MPNKRYDTVRMLKYVTVEYTINTVRLRCYWYRQSIAVIGETIPTT